MKGSAPETSKLAGSVAISIALLLCFAWFFAVFWYPSEWRRQPGEVTEDLSLAIVVSFAMFLHGLILLALAARRIVSCAFALVVLTAPVFHLLGSGLDGLLCLIPF